MGSLTRLLAEITKIYTYPDQTRTSLERAIGDIAFHFIDARGYPVPPEGEAAKRIQWFIQPQPDWNILGHLFHTGKVLLVLTGVKVALAQALIVGAHATRCVLDAQLARGMLADG